MLTGNTNEERIWNYLTAAGLSAAGAAGLMGNLYAESGLNPKNLQNSFEKKLGMTDDQYTAAVDSGSYKNFVRDSAGYGLAQWTYWSRKEALLLFARARGVSVGDLETQLQFLVKELKEDYRSTWSTLLTARSVREASNMVLFRFEAPADQGEYVQIMRAGYGQKYYDRFGTMLKVSVAAVGTGLTESVLRQRVADIICSWKGATKGSEKHRDILDTYNNYKPLARGYKVQTGDAYCATTVSAAFIRAGIAEYTGTECSCNEFINVAKKRGIWVENDAYVPKLGDACLYDWQDSGIGDNVGGADHIGIVTDLRTNSFVVTEGNMSGGKVGDRTMAVNGKYIRGFITPDYAEIARKLDETTKVPVAMNTTEKASVQNGISYTVVAGDTLGKIASRHKMTVKDLVEINEIANPNIINIGQVIYFTAAAAAIGKLARLKVVDTPDYWQQAVINGKVQYLDKLFIKAGKKITKAGTYSTSVQNGIGALVNAGVINSPDYWLEHYLDLPNLGALLRALGGAVR